MNIKHWFVRHIENYQRIPRGFAPAWYYPWSKEGVYLWWGVHLVASAIRAGYIRVFRTRVIAAHEAHYYAARQRGIEFGRKVERDDQRRIVSAAVEAELRKMLTAFVQDLGNEQNPADRLDTAAFAAVERKLAKWLKD